MGAQQMKLSSEQVAFFKTNGYLIVPRAMDLQLCAEAQDLMWEALPNGSTLQRSDKTTHVGPFPTADESHDSEHVRAGYKWQLREIGTNETLLKLVYSEAICRMAQQLLGDSPITRPVLNGSTMGREGPAWPGGPTDPAQGNQGARGIYFTLPYGDKEREPDACHTDGHPFQLGVVGLLGDVPKDGGAFKVWPKSHQRLYPKFQLQYDQPRVPYYDHLPSHKGIIHSQAYLDEVTRLERDTRSVECWGNMGDIVFWHHRTAHMAGHNYSQVIRQAVLADFWTTGLDAARLKPPQEDMWADWSNELKASDGEYSTSFAATQGLPAT